MGRAESWFAPPAVGTAKFNVGDYVELYLRQVSGATRTLAKVPEFSILRIAG